MTVKDLTVVRNERKELCEYCGEEAHKMPLSCPRITSITYDNETDECTIRFRPNGPSSPGPRVA